MAALGFLTIAWLITSTLLDLFGIESRIHNQQIRLAVQYWVMMPLTLLAYGAYVKLFERRPISEFGRRRMLPELGFGYLYGMLLMSLCVGAAVLFGVLSFTGVGVPANLPIAFCLTIAISVVEEVVFRGVLFRIAEKALGSWIAILISAAFFGLGHISNENATLFTAFAISLEAGLLLAAAYMLTRRLWFVIGIHAAWNFTQGGIFGVPVSGVSIDGLFSTELSGPELLSGGAFGLEGSIIAVVICTGFGVFFLCRAARKGFFVSPPWSREAIPVPDSAPPPDPTSAPPEDSARSGH